MASESQRSYWVFNIGTREEPPPRDWLAALPHHASEMWFPPNKPPASVKQGDRCVINGAGRRGFLAAVEVLSTEPEDNDTGDAADRKRWPYRVRYSLLVA